ncbi:nucleotidyltransferase-like protein [Paenibacillus pasadenensis]|uniref:nucleotidyltransferase-like protein n=1 Tax=Paenibacillus pasadenensis TaxID=217090 RepID=UPI00203DC69E|nr:nucleotidyltransferase-like protein [Paenibacillus pasadenensis]
MEILNKQVSSLIEQEEDVIGLVAVRDPYPFQRQLEGLDVLLLVVSETACNSSSIEHRRMDGQHVMIQRVARDLLLNWIKNSRHRDVMEWILRGDIIYDPEDVIERLKSDVRIYSDELMNRKLLVEYSQFLHSFLLAKQNIEDGFLLDAHNHIIKTLNHYAHLELIEAGRHPEPSVWRQMRRFHPGIYKLYEELSTSPETLEQRIQLVLLACEFSMMSKMKSSCTLIFQIMGSRDEPWSMSELSRHPALSDLPIDLSLLLQKSVQRGYLREVAVLAGPLEPDALELRYKLPR